MLKTKEFLFITFLLVLYICSVLVNLGYQELGAEEPRRAIISIEMQQSGNYIRATQMGEEYVNKPVVFNWILCAVMWITGSSSEWVLRIPSLVFFLLLAFVHYRISRIYFQKETALVSAFFVLTSLEIFFYGLMKGAEIDLFYSLLVYIQGISLFYYYEQKKWTQLFIVSYAFCAFGLLTKGFPSLAFQVLGMAALSFYARSVRWLLSWKHLTGILVFLAIVGLYFFAFSFYSSPRRLALNLLNESLIKSSVGERSNRLLEKSLGYPFLIFKLLAPWILLLLLLIRRPYLSIFRNPFVRYSALFFAFNIWVYWFTGQPKARYVYMFVPFACTILIAIYNELRTRQPALLNRILAYFFWIFVLVTAGILVLPFLVETSRAASILLTVILSVFLVIYFRLREQRIWLLILGLVLVRLAFARLMLPVLSDRDFDHRAIARNIAVANRSAPLHFWSPLSPAREEDSGSRSWKMARPPRHSYLFAQIPYYYYQATGQVVKYDSILRRGNTYISLLTESPVDSADRLYSYFEPNQRDSFVVYRWVGTDRR